LYNPITENVCGYSVRGLGAAFRLLNRFDVDGDMCLRVIPDPFPKPNHADGIGVPLLCRAIDGGES